VMDAPTAATRFWANLCSTYGLCVCVCCNYGTSEQKLGLLTVCTAPHNGLSESASKTWNSWHISHREDQLEWGVCKLREGSLFMAVVLHHLRLASSLTHLKSLRSLTIKDSFFNEFRGSFLILFICIKSPISKITLNTFYLNCKQPKMDPHFFQANADSSFK
jgi:hypothetical protein